MDSDRFKNADKKQVPVQTIITRIDWQYKDSFCFYEAKHLQYELFLTARLSTEREKSPGSLYHIVKRSVKALKTAIIRLDCSICESRLYLLPGLRITDLATGFLEQQFAIC